VKDTLLAWLHAEIPLGQGIEQIILDSPSARSHLLLYITTYALVNSIYQICGKGKKK